MPVRPSLKEEIAEALEERSAEVRCLLAGDWGFDQIEADAGRRSGHQYAREMHPTIAGIVARAVHDLERSLNRFRPALSCSAVADFWQSFQVRRHIANFCDELAKSEVANRIAGDHVMARFCVGDARDYVLMKLATFAHEIQSDKPPLEGDHKAREQSADTARSSGEELSAPQTGVRANRDAVSSERRGLVDSYIEEVLKSTKKRITRTDIWKAAGYRTRTEFERWERNDKRATKTANQNIRRILTEKPHLKNSTQGHASSRIAPR